MGVYVPNFNTMELANFLEKKSVASTLDPSGHIEDYIT
jgi:hypothetical protein